MPLKHSNCWKSGIKYWFRCINKKHKCQNSDIISEIAQVFEKRVPNAEPCGTSGPVRIFMFITWQQYLNSDTKAQSIKQDDAKLVTPEQEQDLQYQITGRFYLYCLYKYLSHEEKNK